MNLSLISNNFFSLTCNRIINWVNLLEYFYLFDRSFFLLSLSHSLCFSLLLCANILFDLCQSFISLFSRFFYKWDLLRRCVFSANEQTSTWKSQRKLEGWVNASLSGEYGSKIRWNACSLAWGDRQRMVSHFRKWHYIRERVIKSLRINSDIELTDPNDWICPSQCNWSSTRVQGKSMSKAFSHHSVVSCNRRKTRLETSIACCSSIDSMKDLTHQQGSQCTLATLSQLLGLGRLYWSDIANATFFRSTQMKPTIEQRSERLTSLSLDSVLVKTPLLKRSKSHLVRHRSTTANDIWASMKKSV